MQLVAELIKYLSKTQNSTQNLAPIASACTQ